MSDTCSNVPQCKLDENCLLLLQNWLEKRVKKNNNNSIIVAVVVIVVERNYNKSFAYIKAALKENTNGAYILTHT